MGTGWAADSEWRNLPDPTRPVEIQNHTNGRSATLPRDTPTALNLSFIYVSERQRLAVINGKKYRIGDKIAGFTIHAIWPSYVEMVRGTETRQLSTSVSATDMLHNVFHPSP